MKGKCIWVERSVYSELLSLKKDGETPKDVLKCLVEKLSDEVYEGENEENRFLDGFGKYVCTELEEKVKEGQLKFKRELKKQKPAQ